VTHVSTHVLDTAAGHPAAGVPVEIAVLNDGEWQVVGASVTDADGRCADLPDPELPEGAKGTVMLWFDTATYHATSGSDTFFPEVTLVFVVEHGRRYHVPLLLSPYGYTTYRGS
jgi:5-hydroxyisourate hydrolase